METIIRKEYLDRIKKYIDAPVIKVIIGARRVGKTYFMKQIMDVLKQSTADENMLFINKEDLAWEFITDYTVLHQYIQDYFGKTSGKRYIFIDEIQDISLWENCIRSLHSEEIYDIYISGSNSRLLSSELSTYLTGRFIEFRIYPLCFREFLIFRGNDNSKEEFENYMKYGWLPAIHKMNFEDEIIYSYLGWVFSTIIFKDIISRYNIRNSGLLLDIMKFLSDNIGNIFSAKKISDYLKNQKIPISVDSLREYLQYFENTFLLAKVHRFDIRGKNLLEIYEKYYLGDIGFRSYLLGFRQNNIGQVLENIVYNELLVRWYSVQIGKIWDLEIDFIAEKNGERKYFQVTYLLSHPEVVDREFKPLTKVNDNYEKVVLSMDEYFTKDIEWIKRLHLVDWLLEGG